MSLLPSCPVCSGLLVGNSRTKLSSACRCGYPAKAEWDDFPKAKKEQHRAAA